MSKLRSDNLALNNILTKATYLVGTILLLILISSAVSQQKNEIIKDVFISVEQLPDSSKLITEKDILTAITRSMGRSPHGMPISDINLQRLEEKVLEKDPFISTADVYIDANEKLHIDITQREPLLRIIDANGKSYYLDKQGKHMPLSVNFTARVPVANGYIPPFTPDYDKKRPELRDLYRLAQDLEKDPFMKAHTEQIFMTKKREFILVPNLGKHKIILGRYRDIADKFERLKIFYKEGMPYEGWQKYKSINLKYDGQVVCKKR